MKVAIIVINILDVVLFLFFNYNPSAKKTSGLFNNNTSKINNIIKALVSYKYTKPKENSIEEIPYI